MWTMFHWESNRSGPKLGLSGRGGSRQHLGLLSLDVFSCQSVRTLQGNRAQTRCCRARVILLCYVRSRGGKLFNNCSSLARSRWQFGRNAFSVLPVNSGCRSPAPGERALEGTARPATGTGWGEGEAEPSCLCAAFRL